MRKIAQFPLDNNNKYKYNANIIICFGEIMNVITVIITLLLFAGFIVCVWALIHTDFDAERRQKEQAEWNKKLEYLHGCKRDRFQFAGKTDVPYQDALDILEKLERNEYPVRLPDGKTFNLCDVEDYIAERRKEIKWTTYGNKRHLDTPMMWVDRYSDETREDFRHGLVQVGKDITMYEAPRRMTFAEARTYMDQMIRKEMDRIWKNS